jgi:hypothetical protein
VTGDRYGKLSTLRAALLVCLLLPFLLSNTYAWGFWDMEFKGGVISGKVHSHMGVKEVLLLSGIQEMPGESPTWPYYSLSNILRFYGARVEGRVQTSNGEEFKLRLPLLPLNKGSYRLAILVEDGDTYVTGEFADQLDLYIGRQRWQLLWISMVALVLLLFIPRKRRKSIEELTPSDTETVASTS